MAQSIELYRPFLPANKSKGVLAAYKSAVPVIAAMGFGTELCERLKRTRIGSGPVYGKLGFVVFAHTPGMADYALELRNALLPHFAAANETSMTLGDASMENLDRKTAVAMVGAMLGALGAKGDKETLAGMVALIEDDDLARATKSWRPLNAKPSTLAIACRTLIATCKFVPKPVELADACREAMRELCAAERFCEELVDYIRRCDSLLLEFAPAQWRAPYLTPQYQPIVHQMLTSHAIWGNGDDGWDLNDNDDQLTEKQKARNQSFRDALDRAELEFPELEEIEQQPEQTEKPAAPKIAACTAPAAKKRSKKSDGGKNVAMEDDHGPAR